VVLGGSFPEGGFERFRAQPGAGGRVGAVEVDALGGRERHLCLLAERGRRPQQAGGAIPVPAGRCHARQGLQGRGEHARVAGGAGGIQALLQGRLRLVEVAGELLDRPQALTGLGTVQARAVVFGTLAIRQYRRLA
jgi:hypothetical protein